MFDTLEMSLAVLELLAPLETKIRQRRKSLADEIGRAAESVALNVSVASLRAAPRGVRSGVVEDTATIAFAATAQRFLRLSFTANIGWPVGQGSEREAYGP